MLTLDTQTGLVKLYSVIIEIEIKLSSINTKVERPEQYGQFAYDRHSPHMKNIGNICLLAHVFATTSNP